MVRIPALKLLSFFRALGAGDSAMRVLGSAAETREAIGLAQLATEKIQGASRTIREMPALSTEDVQRWIAFWTSKGLFGYSS